MSFRIHTLTLLTCLRFAALPKPKETDWELELPEEQQDILNDIEVSEEDAAERDRRNKAIREATQRLEFNRRTQVMQRALPRPAVLDIDSLIKTATTVDNVVAKAISQEMALLIANDALKFPILGRKVRGTSRPLETFDDDMLNKARLEIARELPAEEVEKRKAEFEGVWQDVHNQSKLPGLAGYEDNEIDEHQLMVETFDVRFLSLFLCSSKDYLLTRLLFYRLCNPPSPLPQQKATPSKNASLSTSPGIRVAPVPSARKSQKQPMPSPKRTSPLKQHARCR